MILADARRNVARALHNAGIDASDDEARWLLADVLKLPLSSFVLQSDYVLSSDEEKGVHDWCQRRACREPLSRIRGYREFWSLDFALNEATLDPRPDSETLIEAVLDLYPHKKDALQFLDLGTGSGCLLLTLLHEFPHAQGVGIDLSENAAHMAQSNAISLNVNDRASFVVGEWACALSTTFDVIISNPPYIPLEDKGTLAPEVLHHDPHLALFGGDDGLEAYRLLAQEMPSLLKKDSLLVLEIGQGQESDIITIFQQYGFALKIQYPDLAGIIRCLVFEKF